MAPDCAQESIVLDVAPSRQISSSIRAISPDTYCSIDFDPDADGRTVDVVASLTDLPFGDASVGMLVCFHVLEHVPDDRMAMREIARVLRPDGLALIQVPWRDGVLTDEDADTTPEERLRRFGQRDHVRYYGTDFVSRLEEAGLSVEHMRSRDLIDPSLMAALGIPPREHIWFVASDERALPNFDQIRQGIQAWLAATVSRSVSASQDDTTSNALKRSKAEAVRFREAAERQRHAAATWKRRYRDLSGRLPVRVMAKLSRPFRNR